jgi:hypothetical protein
MSRSEGVSTARLEAGASDSRVDAAVRTVNRGVHRQRLERCLGALQPVLTARAFVGVCGRVRSRGEFAQTVACGVHALSSSRVAQYDQAGACHDALGGTPSESTPCVTMRPGRREKPP